MDTQPVTLNAVKHQGRAARSVERGAVFVKADAVPRRDHAGHPPVIGDQYAGLVEIKAEPVGARPDIVPLGGHPLINAGDHVAMGAEGQNLRMEQRPGGRVVNIADKGGKPVEPDDKFSARLGTGFGQWGHRNRFLANGQRHSTLMPACCRGIVVGWRPTCRKGGAR